jgi:acyl-CoA thioesterase FadM
MYSLRVPRHACSPRDVARSGELWRLVQEVAVMDAVAAGWPPARFRESGTGFLVRSLCGVHMAEVRYGERIDATTCVPEVRREMMLRRETLLPGVLRASVEWVHCGADTAPDGRGFGGPTRAPADMLAALSGTGDPSTGCGPSPTLPALDAVPPRALPALAFDPWWTEMDPLGHVNHPRYVDWADEVLARWLSARGLDPADVRPLADAFTFRGGAAAGQHVEVRAEVVAARADAACLRISVSADGRRAAEGTIVRAHPAGPDAWR